jgi:hypothetical protein
LVERRLRRSLRRHCPRTHRHRWSNSVRVEWLAAITGRFGAIAGRFGAIAGRFGVIAGRFSAITGRLVTIVGQTSPSSVA